MPSFKEAAFEILKETDRPLRTPELMKKILDKKLVNTTGKTPFRTLYTELYRDIQTHKNRSKFKQVGRGLFALNPKYEVLKVGNRADIVA